MDWILCQVIRREAKALLDSTAPTTRHAEN
jgi:hypothetical protein